MGPPPPEHLTRREREIMDAIFALGNRATAEEIRARLADPPSYTAVRTMLTRLEQKGTCVTRCRALVTSTPPLRRRGRNVRPCGGSRDVLRGLAPRAGTSLLRDETWTNDELDELQSEIDRSQAEGENHDGHAAQAALSLGAFRLSILAKATVIMVVALIAVRCSHRAPASMRHIVLASAFAVVLVLPFAERRALNHIAFRSSVASNGAGSADHERGGGAFHACSCRGHVRTETGGLDRCGAGPRAGCSLPSGCLRFVCLVPVLLTPWRLRQLRRAARQWPERDWLARALDPRPGSGSRGARS